MMITSYPAKNKQKCKTKNLIPLFRTLTITPTTVNLEVKARTQSALNSWVGSKIILTKCLKVVKIVNPQNLLWPASRNLKLTKIGSHLTTLLIMIIIAGNTLDRFCLILLNKKQTVTFIHPLPAPCRPGITRIPLLLNSLGPLRKKGRWFSQLKSLKINWLQLVTQLCWATSNGWCNRREAQWPSLIIVQLITQVTWLIWLTNEPWVHKTPDPSYTTTQTTRSLDRVNSLYSLINSNNSSSIIKR